MAEREGNVVAAVIFSSILIVCLFLAAVVVFNAVANSNVSTNAGTVLVGVNVQNESCAINGTGHALAGSTAYGFTTPVLLKVYNQSDGAVVALGNFTTSAAGVVKNASAVVWNAVNISYTYNYDPSTNAFNNNISQIQTNVISTGVAFFSLAPVVGTVFAVIVLIAGIVLLVIYVRRMGSAKTTEEGFRG